MSKEERKAFVKPEQARACLEKALWAAGSNAKTEQKTLRYSFDEISESPKQYNGKPVINFIKELNGRVTVSAVVSNKRLDLFVQTAFIGIKKEIFPHR